MAYRLPRGFRDLPNEAQEIALAQGWNASSIETLLQSYEAESKRRSDRGLIRYLDRQARFENASCP